MVRQYTIRDINSVIKRNIIIIVILTMVGALCACLYAKKKQVTTYTAKSSVIVGQNLTNVNYKNSAVQAELGMMKSYEEVTESDSTLLIAHRNLSKHDKKLISEDDLSSDVTVNSHPNSVVLSIMATSSNRSKSVKMANAVAKASVSQIKKYSPVDSQVKIMSIARKKGAVSHTHPSVKKYTVLGAAIGLLIGMIASFSITTWKNDN